MTATPGVLQPLLAWAVDYAGLFPPASLDMRAAAASYARHLAGEHAWALGRFVVPAARLDELAAACAELPETPDAWRVSALVGQRPGALAHDVERVESFNADRAELVAEIGAPLIVVDALEARAASAAEVRAIAASAARWRSLHVEIPVDDDPAPLVAAIAEAGASAKIRTGGVTAGAFPATAHVVRFLRCCVDAGVPFKATAGLHHPLRAEHRLTYAPDAPRGTMFGFLNVILATALVCAGGSDADAARLLELRDASALAFDDGGVAWEGRRWTTEQLADARERGIRSFGSCSFEEPLADLRALGLLA